MLFLLRMALNKEQSSDSILQVPSPIFQILCPYSCWHGRSFQNSQQIWDIMQSAVLNSLSELVCPVKCQSKSHYLKWTNPFFNLEISILVCIPLPS